MTRGIMTRRRRPALTLHRREDLEPEPTREVDWSCDAAQEDLVFMMTGWKLDALTLPSLALVRAQLDRREAELRSAE